MKECTSNESGKRKKRRKVVLYRVIFFSLSSSLFTMSRHICVSAWTPCWPRRLPIGNVCAWMMALRMNPVPFLMNTPKGMHVSSFSIKRTVASPPPVTSPLIMLKANGFASWMGMMCGMLHFFQKFFKRCFMDRSLIWFKLGTRGLAPERR